VRPASCLAGLVAALVLVGCGSSAAPETTTSRAPAATVPSASKPGGGPATTSMNGNSLRPGPGVAAFGSKSGG